MDHKLYKSEKKLAAQGWQAMRRTLDREMPESRRRKPVAFFWLLGLLLASGGVLSWLLLQPALPLAPSTTPIAAAPAAGTPTAPELAGTPAHPATTTSAAQQNDHALAGANKLREPTSHTITRQALPSRQVPEEIMTPPVTTPGPSHSAIVQESGQIPVPEKVVTTDVSPAPLQIPVETQPEVTQQEISTNPIASATENTPILSDPPTANPAPAPVKADMSHTRVPGNPTALQPNIAQSPIPPPIQPITDPAGKKWTLGASAGVLSDGSANYAGASAGLMASWKPFRQWGLRSGLNYQYQPLPASDRPVVSLTTASYEKATGESLTTFNTGSPGPTQADASSPVYVPVARLHRVEVPVMAFYQPFSKLRLYGGISLVGSVYAEAGDRSLNNNTVYRLNTSASSLNQEISDKVRSWDTRWGIGIGFMPLRQLELGLYYQHRLGFGQHAKAADLQFDIGAAPGYKFSADPVSGNSAVERPLLQFLATWFF